MTVVDTSLAAYGELQGSRAAIEQRVLELLRQHGPMTAAEAEQAFDQPSVRPIVPPRLTDLKNRGMVEKIGKRECRVTGRLVYVWRAT